MSDICANFRALIAARFGLLSPLEFSDFSPGFKK